MPFVTTYRGFCILSLLDSCCLLIACFYFQVEPPKPCNSDSLLMKPDTDVRERLSNSIPFICLCTLKPDLQNKFFTNDLSRNANKLQYPILLNI